LVVLLAMFALYRTTAPAPPEAAEPTTTTATTTTTHQTAPPRFMNEVGHCSEASKIAVANVILNRVDSANFPNTVKEVVYAKNQFSAAYGSLKPDKSTRAAVRKALDGEDNSMGAVYYYAPRYVHDRQVIAWFEGLHYLFELDGQRYFKIRRNCK